MMACEWKKLFVRVPAGCQEALSDTTNVSTCVRYVIMHGARWYLGTKRKRELQLIRQVC